MLIPDLFGHDQLDFPAVIRISTTFELLFLYDLQLGEAGQTSSEHIRPEAETLIHTQTQMHTHL